MAIRPGDELAFDPDKLSADPEDVVTICPALLHIERRTKQYGYKLMTILEMDDVSSKNTTKLVRLDHFSVQEYFLSPRCSFRKHFDAQSCQAILAKSYLHYLLYTCTFGPMTRQRVQRSPLAKYAADSWSRHLLLIPDRPDDILGLAETLLDNPTGILSCTRLNPSSASFVDWRIPESDSQQPLPFAACAGIRELVLRYLKDPLPSKDTLGKALIRAAQNDHTDIVRLLLDAGADIEWTEGDEIGYTALTYATQGGHEQTAHILLDEGANVQPGTLYYVTPLGQSAIYRLDSVCHRILDKGVDSCARMELLAERGISLDIFQRVLAMGTDINGTGLGLKPIQSAAMHCRTDLVEALINSGAAVNAVGEETKESALMIVIHEGHEELVSMLLKAEAQYDTKCLAKAAEFDNTHSIAALIEAGMSVQEVGDERISPLETACLYKGKDALRMLLDNGAVVNQRTECYGSVLQAICCFPLTAFKIQTQITPDFEVHPNGNSCDQIALCFTSSEVCLKLMLDFRETEDDTGIVKVYRDQNVDDQKLLEAFSSNDDVSTKLMSIFNFELLNSEISLEKVWLHYEQNGRWTNYRQTITWVAACDANGLTTFDVAAEDEESICQTLLDLGAGIELKTPKEQAPSGSEKLLIEFVETLLTAAAEVDIKGDLYGCALQAAARFTHIDVVRILLSRGANVNITGGLFGTVLQGAAASFQEWLPLVRLLIHAGADINAKAGEYGCALSAAAYRGHIGIVGLLLKSGADVNLQGGRYGTALQAACISPHSTPELLRLPLDAGADRNIPGGKFSSAAQALICGGVRAVANIPQYRAHRS